MSRRKREITGLSNERDFPHLVELALPPGGFRSVFLDFDAFHRERRIPVRRGRSRHEAEQSHILLPRHRHRRCILRSLRWCAPDLRTRESQAADFAPHGRYVGGESGQVSGVGKNRIMIFAPKPNGTCYVVEFRTAAGEALAISIPRGEAAVIRHFQKRMPPC
jgi:hypothetical protein